MYPINLGIGTIVTKISSTTKSFEKLNLSKLSIDNIAKCLKLYKAKIGGGGGESSPTERFEEKLDLGEIWGLKNNIIKLRIVNTETSQIV